MISVDTAFAVVDESLDRGRILDNQHMLRRRKLDPAERHRAFRARPYAAARNLRRRVDQNPVILQSQLDRDRHLLAEAAAAEYSIVAQPEYRDPAAAVREGLPCIGVPLEKRSGKRLRRKGLSVEAAERIDAVGAEKHPPAAELEELRALVEAVNPAAERPD